MTLTQRRQIAVEVTNRGVADGGKAVDPGVETRGGIYHQRSIRPPRWPHLNLETTVSRGDMMFQRIDRIIGGTHHFYVHLPHDAASRELRLGQFGVGVIPNGFRGRRIEQAIADTKRPF